jgi:hypothetical protein
MLEPGLGSLSFKETLMKRLLALVCICLATASLAIAGGSEKGKAAAGSAPAPDMAAMKAEMMNCAICKPLAPAMEKIGPVMTTEVVRMDNGMAIVHVISDPSVVPTFHKACAEMQAAGKATMALPEAEWKAAICDHCEQMMSLVQSGATISLGETKNGSILVLNSADPAVQTKIASFEAQCEKQMGAMAEHKGM